MERMIYLDYAATSPVFREVLAEMNAVARSFYANSSSLYSIGYDARRLLQESRAALARSINVEHDEIVFTSGGTEANNLALFGVVRASRRGRHLIVGSTEHHSVLHAARALEREGVRLTVLPCDSDGRYDPEALDRTICPDTALVSLHLSNNETGVLQPIGEIGAITRAHRVPLHCDATAAFGHVSIDARALNIDLLSAAAHKFGGPKGIGFLYVRNEIPIAPLFCGGLQERSLRPGTENLPAIAGFARALTCAALPASSAARDRLEARLVTLLPDTRVNGANAPRLPHILSIAIPGVQGERLLPLLDAAGICASARAACAGTDREPSHVLLAMGQNRVQADETIRFSTGFPTKLSEIDRAINVIVFVLYNNNLI